MRKKSVINFVLTRQDEETVISMEIDEQKEFTPYRRKTENGQIVKTYSDQNTIIVKLNILGHG